jgi:hypothetical protein
VYRALLNWNRISKKLDVLHAFGSENSGPELLPALGSLLESRLFSESEQLLLSLPAGKTISTDYEDVVFCLVPYPPEGYPREETYGLDQLNRGGETEPGLNAISQKEKVEHPTGSDPKRILVTTGEHHSPFGKRVSSIGDLPDSIRQIFKKISQLEHVTAIYFGEYTPKHSRIGPKIVISQYEKNSGRILGFLIGDFKGAAKVKMDIRVMEGKELDTIRGMKVALKDICEFILLFEK